MNRTSLWSKEFIFKPSLAVGLFTLNLYHLVADLMPWNQVILPNGHLQRPKRRGSVASRAQYWLMNAMVQTRFVTRIYRVITEVSVVLEGDCIVDFE